LLLGFEGNWGVMQAVERLSEWTALGTHLQARLFMGKKRIGNVKMDVSLSSKDSTRTVTAQWDSLRYVQCRLCIQVIYLTSIDASTIQCMHVLV
jgi:hypothetical protein